MIDLNIYKTRDLIEVSCAECNTVFKRIKRDVQRNVRLKRNIYCSRKCSGTSKNTHTAIKCLNCSILFSAPKNENRKFCSSSCSASTNNSNRKVARVCLHCNKEITGYKYCDSMCQHTYKMLQRIACNTASTTTLKKYLIKTYGHKCWKCHNTEWNNQTIALELEHIDGNSTNNLLSNLEILCCNCHAQTPTYKGKNKGNGRHSRKLRYRQGKSY